MPIDPLEQAAKQGTLYRNIPVHRLPREIVLELKLLDLDRGREKFGTVPPSRTLIASLFLASGLFFFAAYFPMRRLLYPVTGTGKIPYLVLFLVFFIVGFFLLLLSARFFMKRIRSGRYYLFLTDSYLLERFPGRITFIPRSRLLYAFERRRMAPSRNGADLYFDTVVYRGAEGEEILYDMQDHYFHHPESDRQSHDNIYRVVRRKFGIGGPPPQSAYLQKQY